MFNVAELQKTLIEYVDKKGHLSFEEGTALLNRVGRGPKDPTNEIGIRVNIYTEPNASEGWISEGADYPKADSEKSVNLAIKYKACFKVGEISLHARVQEDANAMWNPISKGVSRAISGLKKIINGHMQASDGTGAIAVISANYNGGTPTVMTCGASRGTFGVQKLLKRKKIQIYDSTATTLRQAGVGPGPFEVSSTNRSSRTATYTSNLPTDFVDTDIVVPDGSVNNVMKGLPFIINDSGDYFGQSRTANPTLKATIEDAGGASATISLMDKVFNVMVYKIGTEMDEAETDDLELWWSPAQLQNYRNQGFSLREIKGGPNAERLEQGFSRQGATVSGYKTNVDVDHVHSTVSYVRHSKLKMAELMPPKVLPLNGQLLVPATAASGQGYAAKFFFHLGYFGEFYSPEPYCLGALENCDVTNLPTGNQ